MSGQISPAALLPALPAVLMGIILFLTARKLRIEREQSEAGPLPENPSDKDGGNRLAGALRRVCQGAAPQLSTTEAAQLWAVIAFAPSVFILAMGSTAGAVAALPLGIAAFPIWVKSKRGAEQGLFEEQLGQAMPLIASNLRTGASIAQSVAPVAEHMDEPLKSEFAILERDLRNGRPIDQALDDMAKRTKSSNLRLYSTAVSVSQQTGGSLSEITERVGEAIRAKVKAKRSAEAKASSARFEAKIVGFAPIVMLLLMSVASEMHRQFFMTPAGWACLGVGIALDIIGFMVLKQISNIRYD